MTLLDNAVLGPAKADKRIAFIEHVPIVLRPGVVLGKRITFAMLERETAEDKVAYWNIFGALTINFTFEPDKLDQPEEPRLASRFVARDKPFSLSC